MSKLTVTLRATPAPKAGALRSMPWCIGLLSTRFSQFADEVPELQTLPTTFSGGGQIEGAGPV